MRATPSIDWRLRAKVVAQRFWQPTSACMVCMPGSLSHLWSAMHWETALRTGAFTALIALTFTFTPAAWLYRNRYGNACLVGAFTAIGDSISHPSRYGSFHAEALLTGAVSASLALIASYLFEGRAQRLRSAWAFLRGHHA